MSEPIESTADDNPQHLFSRIDLMFFGSMLLVFLSYPLLPGLPLLPAAAAMATRVRASRWRVVTLWVTAGILALIVITPFIIGLFDLTFVEVN
ncbi:hypothetical protein [Arthrobacter sp. B1805]|uniref:hypothetical protein n=1 Tax=Arthrobacter sp. B1805 TaxID=2058892 RepID=UPI0011B022E3|nr:hypothetical protein [Arthrobacter sp. B1805]